MTNLPVDIYCRAATDSQEGDNTLDKQEAACRSYCEERGLLVAMVHHEVAPGNTYHDRELLTLMRRRYLQGDIHGVVVSSSNRLSRPLVHLVLLVHEMETNDVTFHCVDEYTSLMTDNVMVRMLLSFLDEFEREKTLDRLLTE